MPGIANNAANLVERSLPLARPVLLICALVAVTALSWTFHLGSRLSELRAWIVGLGPLGLIVFVGINVAGIVVAAPAEIFTILGASIFGSLKGILAISIASPIGATLSFLIARHFARNQVAAWLAPKAKLSKLDAFTEKDGAAIVAVARLAHILPANMLNYVLGLTRVRFAPYIVVSWICMLPTTVFYVVGTDALVKGFARGRVPWGRVSIIAVASTIVLASLWIAVRRLCHYHRRAGALGAVETGVRPATEAAGGE
jgi:uncharacterized membrane protein YdjX (TVP38/TMEM64 family)